jgi:large subunit ribosomal protein L17
MRHRVAGKVLNADTQHRLALRRNLSRSLFLHGRIITTLAKAKATRRFTEKLITRARRALAHRAAGDNSKWLHQVRLLARDVKDKDVLRKLLAEVAPRANRPGGYTRIVRDWKNQVGDNAPRAIFELVDRVVEAEPEADEDADAKGSSQGKGAKGGKGGKKPKGKAKKPTPAKGGKKAAAAEPAEAE